MTPLPTHWTHGYVAEVTYPYTYVPELNPLRLQLPFLRAGLAVPQVRTACELGFGQGLSINVHAAASGVQWYGNDFNPDQALNARTLAAASGVPLPLSDASFAEFCARDDLPDFDFIGLHGVWSWISADNRAHIVDFIRRKLNVSGVVYLGYNTQPGWAAMVPLRELMARYVQHATPPGDGLGPQIQAALQFAERLLATDPEYARLHPTMAPLVAALQAQDTHYLAHEFFNRSWQPMAFTEIADALAPAKLRFACSAHHSVDWLDLSPAQHTLVQGIADPVLRESVRDFCMNQQFRKDYWVKGARTLNPIEHGQALRALQVVLLKPVQEIASTVLTARGPVPLDPQVLGPLLAALADHTPRSLAALEQSMADTGIQNCQILDMLALLEANGDLATAQSAEQASAAKQPADRLNMHLLNQALGSGDIPYIASPVSGSAVALNRVEQLFLCASLEAPCQVSDLAPRVWPVLEAQGKKLLRDGQPLHTAADNLAELDRLARIFARTRLPLLTALGCYPGVAAG